MAAKLLAFGEILWDVYPDEKFLGGASLNFAAPRSTLASSCPMKVTDARSPKGGHFCR